jgi:hypothetical protein
MTVTREELDDFRQFASERLNHGGADTIVELAAMWQLAREQPSANAAIAQGIAEMEAGLAKPADAVMEELRDEFRLNRE